MTFMGGRYLAVRIVALVAVLLAASPAFADGVPIEEANISQLKAAQKTFEAADELFDAQQYEAAIKAFRTSSEIVASPNSRLMIARAMQKLGKFGDAYSELESAIDLAERAAAKDPKYEATLKAVREELLALKSKVGILHVKMARPTAAAVTIGERPIDAAALSHPIVVTPGNVTIVAHADGYSDLRRNVKVAAGEDVNVKLELTPVGPAANELPPEEPRSTPAPAPSSGSGLRTAAFVVGGIGVVGFVGFGVFGAMHLSSYSKLEDECPAGVCTAEHQSDIDSGKTYQTVANVGLVVGIVGAAAGVTLFVLSSRKSAAAPAPTALSSVSMGPGSLRLGGRF
jgi:hypothetical protein